MSRRWHVAHSLMVLLNEVNKRWPNRSKTSDGTIGDAAHSSRTSDHNPNARGSVNARDVTARGINPMELVNAAIKHPSVNYVIFNRTIRSRSRGFAPRLYAGANPHTGHVHISILQTVKAENSNVPWGLLAAPGLPNTGAPGPSPTPTPEEDIMTPEQEARIIEAIRAERRTTQKEGFDRSGFTPIGRNAADHVFAEPVEANGRVRRAKDHLATLFVDSHATAAAVSLLMQQMAALSQQQGVDIDTRALDEAVERIEAAAEGIETVDVGTAVAEALAEHFPSMARAEADDIADSVLDKLGERLQG